MLVNRGAGTVFMKTQKTKERILDEALNLFSERGYDSVSMRDIAAKVGIKAASIYNHFTSKKDILKEIYTFYIDEKKRVFPSLEKLLTLVETEPIREVLMKMEYYFDPPLQDKMDRIFFIASQRICRDKDICILKNFFESVNEILYAILNRAMELGRIDPLDVNSFVRLTSYYAFSAAELNLTEMKISREQWRKGLLMLFSLVKPVNGKKEAHYGDGFTGPTTRKKKNGKRGNTVAGK
jgi:AcrR family transcriptional regulator